MQFLIIDLENQTKQKHIKYAGRSEKKLTKTRETIKQNLNSKKYILTYIHGYTCLINMINWYKE